MVQKSNSHWSTLLPPSEMSFCFITMFWRLCIITMFWILCIILFSEELIVRSMDSVCWPMYISHFPGRRQLPNLINAGKFNSKWSVCWSVYVDCTSPFHQFELLVALASAWSLTWYQSLRSRVQVLAFAIYYKIVVTPRCRCTRPLVSTSESLHVVTCPSHVSGDVEVYMWIVLALSISSDFWLCWLVHEA
jgi:hypothetical protein